MDLLKKQNAALKHQLAQLEALEREMTAAMGGPEDSEEKQQKAKEEEKIRQGLSV